ncbi:hypothetical protein GRI42_01995 [Erythrobacter gaetbuli]|uniref:Uncharacterized protein n=1 Tax=Qipengyuania gaetbuli TaxID=266952 RepID=A0A844XY91_9SPHN|nr:hypothetical protein [Qipengyuania gaetbuli]MXO50073.1 hypothetical protein [Qipengyuania gaetbuli]
MAANDPFADIQDFTILRPMRPAFFLAILALGAAGCSDQNLLGEEVWSDERLAQADVGFGWNFEVESEESPSRTLNVLIHPDNSYQIEIIGYRNETPPETLSRADGKLLPITANRLRRSLARLRSDNAQDLFTSMPGCPERLHPAIEYYVGFESGEKSALTVLDPQCETPETVEGRRIIAEAIGVFPQVDRTKVLAGSVEL